MAIENAGGSNQNDRTFKVDIDRTLKQEAPLLAPLLDGYRANAKAPDSGTVSAHVGNLSIDGAGRPEAGGSEASSKADNSRTATTERSKTAAESDMPINKEETAKMAHDGLMRAEYKREAEKMLDAAGKSDQVKKGEGYYQVLKRMHPDMKPGELYKLSKEVRTVNGNNHILHRGQQFDLLSPEQKKQVLGNIMNDYDRAHGAKGLNDAAIDPVAARIANEIKARVEKAAEPALKKSFEPGTKPTDGPPTPDSKPTDKKPTDKPPTDKPPTDTSSKPTDTKPTDSCKPDELPFPEKVRLAVEACHDKYDDVNHSAKLAEYIAKRYSPEADEYKWAMKGLADEMAQERKALNDFQKLVQQHPEDRELTRELQKDLTSFTKQQVRIMKALHNTSVISDEQSA